MYLLSISLLNERKKRIMRLRFLFGEVFVYSSDELFKFSHSHENVHMGGGQMHSKNFLELFTSAKRAKGENGRAMHFFSFSFKRPFPCSCSLSLSLYLYSVSSLTENQSQAEKWLQDSWKYPMVKTHSVSTRCYLQMYGCCHWQLISVNDS